MRAQLFTLFDRTARFTAVVTIGDIERVFVGKGGLDTRPRAHIETNLLAHVTGERVSRESEDADPRIGHERSLPGGQFFHQRGRIGEIEDPRAAGPPRHY